MKNKLYRFWETGYGYIAIAILIFLIYALNNRIGTYDWQKEVAYFQYIKASLTSYHSLPWFWWNKLDNIAWYPAISQTSIFISNPETMLFSPFTPLLFLMDVLPYVKLLALIHCAIGIAGSFALKKRLQWDLHQFRIYSILFLLSPIILQHLSIGYNPWLNLFFFPWLIYFVSDEKTTSSILGTSMVLGLILLQGGTHIFIWFAMLISLYSLLKAYFEKNWKFLFRLLGIFCLAALLSSVRIYATSQAYADFLRSPDPGYNPLNFMTWALVPPVLIPPFKSFFIQLKWMEVPSWDAAIFWGLALVMIFILIKNYASYKHKLSTSHSNQKHRVMYDALLIASSILLILSFYSLFPSIISTVNNIIHIPFSEAVEKYPYRLAIPAFLGFSVVIAAYSKEIFRTIEDYLHRLSRSSIISKFVRVLKYSSITIFVILTTTLIASFFFSRIIQKNIYNSIQTAYYGTGNFWLSKFMESRSVYSLEYYINRADKFYSQAQISLLLFLTGIAIFVIVFLFLKSKIRKAEYAIELVLLVPFVFASVMWLSVGISIPFNEYPAQTILPPDVITKPADAKLKIDVSPQRFTIIPQEGIQAVEYNFPEISYADSKSLFVASNNAKISDLNGKMSLVPLDNRPIVLEFDSKSYYPAFILTVVTWLVVIGSLISQRKHSHKTIKIH